MTPAIAFNPRGEAANFLSHAANPVPSGRRLPGRTGPTPTTALAPISATILTKNSEPLLGEVLAALVWCDEVVVLDSGSSDGTLAIATTFANVSLFRLDGPFPGFGRAHRQAVGFARHDWILSVDSDEIVSAGLAAEIGALSLDPRTVYTIPFRNFYNGRHITTCGWSPERHERLFHRAATNFCTSAVHERVQTGGLAVIPLRHPIAHYSYRTTADFLRKLSTYSHLFAAQNRGRRKASPLIAVARSGWAFFRSYLLERGFLQGCEGLTISVYKAQVVFWKYLMLYEANRRRAA